MKNIIHFESITQIHDALGLEKPKHPLVTVLKIDDRIKNYNYGNSTYTFGFYQVSLKSGIEGAISYGRNSYDFQEGSVIFSKPDQAMSYQVDGENEEGEGWVLLFHPDLIRKSELGRSIQKYGFFSYETHEALHLSEEERKSITDIVGKIQYEYSLNLDRHSQKLIISNIELLLDYCTRYYDRQFYVRTNLNQDLVSKFEQILIEYFNTQKTLEHGLPTVKHCAEN